MKTIKLHGQTGSDGVLRLEVPTGLADEVVEILVVISPIGNVGEDRIEWLKFIEDTAGSLSHDPIERPPQGEYEVRDSIE
jgi:hypothetical protein